MTYLEFDFTVSPLQPASEILIAELATIGFESFVEKDEGVLAYILKDDFNEKKLQELFILNSSEFQISFDRKEIAKTNWNEEWEKNFEPIVVESNCAIRAPFHPPFNVDYEIIIEPKMSFGTGHHETTHMMLQYILEHDFTGEKVLDMGCGTAVLGILAKMRGAVKVDAVDIDPWCVENSQENIERNNVTNVFPLLGDASTILNLDNYDTIIANINRNILMEDIKKYTHVLKEGGILYLSGFYVDDLEIINKSCNKHGLRFVSNKTRNNWIAAKFVN